jgi:lipid A 3-O-deacylase
MPITKVALRCALIAGAAMMSCGPTLAHAESTWGTQFAYGFANDHEVHTQKFDLGLVWDPHWTFWHIGGWNFAAVGEAHAVYWDVGTSARKTIGEFGVSPVLRFEKSSGALRPYVEAGVGVRLLTHDRLSDTYTMSTAFQFADMLGVGVKFGNHQQYQVGYRFQHLSNASIKRPNPGIDFHQIYVQYNFR